MSDPDSCFRMMAAACRKTVKCPFRWVAMTASHSSSAMLKSIRSRRIPATATTPSIRPQCSTAVFTMRSPPPIVLTSSATATASPPAASISLTTASATALVGSSPARPDADVGHHHLGALGGTGQGAGPTDPDARSGDDNGLAVEETCHLASSADLVGCLLRAPVHRRGTATRHTARRLDAYENTF